MNRSTSRDSTSDAALRELERALDAFMATHVTTAANSLATVAAKNGTEELGAFLDEDNDEPVEDDTSQEVATFQRDLRRLQCLSSVVTSTRQRRGLSSIVSVGRLLLAWLQTVESSSAAAAASLGSGSGASPAPSAVEAARVAEQAQQQSPIDPVASWLVATLLHVAFQVSSTSSSADLSSVERAPIDELVAYVVGRCLQAFQRAWQADEEAQRRARAESSGTLFSYLTMRKAKLKTQVPSGPPNALAMCSTCTTEAAVVWGHVLGLAAPFAPEVSRMLLQKEILARAAVWNATKPSSASGDNFQHPYLKHLTCIRLGLAHAQAHSSSKLTSRVSEASRWLRVAMPLLLKPHRSHLRCACAHLISQMLIHELNSFTREELNALYMSTGSDWSRCISDLHAAALRLTDCAKKKSRSRSQQHLESSSWALRTVVLALAPGEIFARYWREDVLALLRLQCHLNQDASAGGATSYNVLPSLELSFTYLMHRHFLLRDSGATAAGAPSDSDCMEVINTTQAWAFFSMPRLRPQSSNGTGISNFTALKTIALPALVHVSRAIASYNMVYTVQSHLRRLLAEPVGVGDPQKLIGLEALADLLSNSRDDRGNADDNELSFQVNDKDLIASRQMVGELVGRVLLECSTRIGHKLLTEIPVTMNKHDKLRPRHLGSDDGDEEDEEHWKDPKHAVAVATFAAALSLIPPLYAHLGLSNEQKLLLLVRTSVNAERTVHRHAHEALLSLIGPQGSHSTEPPPPGAAMVVRGLTDYIMRMHVSTTTAVSDAAGAIIILRLLSVLLEPSRAAVTRWESPRARFEALIQVEAIAVYLLARGDDNVEAEQLLRLAALETIEVAHDARVACCELPAVRTSVQLPLVDRPSVWTLLGDLDPDLQSALFTFGPTAAEDSNPNLLETFGDKHPALRRLIFDTSERHSFRWSLCLARIFRCLAKRAPDVTAYIWADVADKVTKLEPVLSVTPVAIDSQNQRELARWRNLALLATVSACPILQTQTRKTEVSSFSSENSSHCSSIAPSVAPSTIVASLIRQLACYLRSASIAQRNSAVLALGHAGSMALPTLLEVLARLEGEAFTTTTNGDQEPTEGSSPSHISLPRSRSVRTAKLPRKKLLELQHARTAQVTLQWAIGRCYRLLLESRTREQHDNSDLEPSGSMGERLRQVVSTFLAKMVSALEGTTISQGDSSEVSEGSLTITSATQIPEENPVLFMVQLDFIASLRALLLHSNAATKPELQLPHDKLAALLLSWSGSFEKDLAVAPLAGYLHSGFVSQEAGSGLYSHWMHLCDVHAARDGELVFPWIWIDNQHQLLGAVGSASDVCTASQRVAQYFLCHRAFSALVELLRSSLKASDGTGTWDGDSVAVWLDACFSVDAVSFPHFTDLHQFAQRALHALLDLPPGSARFNHVVKRCLEKATCAFSSAGKCEQRVARQYLEALGASTEVMAFFRSLLLRLQERSRETQDKDESYLAVRLLHAQLVHVGIQLDDRLVQQHRQVALDMVAALVCEPDAGGNDDETAATRWGLQGYYSPSLEGMVAGRLQVSVSALLASRFSVLSLRVSLAILRSMPAKPLQSRDDVAQQRQMLAAVLPWLAEVPLKASNEQINRPAELLELLFDLTTTLGDSCSEQLDHIWLTLAFGSTGGDDANLKAIVGFLFRQQRKSQLTCETPKTIMWWLCRWQDAASDVLRLLLLQLPPSAANESDQSEAVCALDELGALVILASDTSCHLLQAGANTSNTDVRALAIHLVHMSLTTLFALLDNDTMETGMSRSITQHCHVLLHSVLPLLEAPRGLLAAALALIQATTSGDETILVKTSEENKPSSEEFLEAVRALAVCLSTAEAQVWSELCVQEIALAISLDAPSTLESQENLRRPSPPHEVCVRFALVAYTQLCPRFQGDVLLSVLTLLRQTLTTGVDDGRLPRSLSLARECLALIAMLIRSMPASRLVLYPQVFWVSLALLTHCRQQQRDNTLSSNTSLHDGALELLSILWNRTPFTSHAVAQDLIRYTRPAQWESNTARNSVLVEIVRCIYSDDDLESRTRAMDMLKKAVLLVPLDLLGVTRREHLVICTLALLPALAIPSVGDTYVESDRYTWDDLIVRWQTVGTSAAHEQMLELLQTRHLVQNERGSNHKVAAKFVTVFISALYSLEQDGSLDNSEFDGLKLSLEVLVASLPLPAGTQPRKTPLSDKVSADPNSERSNFVFVVLEELLRDVLQRKETMKRAWKPVPELEATLARLLRSPKNERQWRASVRVLSWVAEMTKATSGSMVSPLPVSPSARKSLPNGKSTETALGRIAESEDDLPSANANVHVGSPPTTVDANTLKKTPSTRALMRLMAPRSRSSDSISKKSMNEAAGNNSELSPEPPSMKEYRLSEQPGSECEDQTIPGEVESVLQ